jgi:alkanesulfonate monooxygenase SsuD/methylene tetrahydromethanopterin reductase-like flavin-dependent oxidoreductase (luciferase family)
VRTMRLSDEFIAKVDAWAAQQDDDPARSEAVRRLVEMGLTVKTPAQPVSKRVRSARAADLAAKAIDGMIDPSAPPEERAQRRRRLTKGPKEFQEDRVDLPKAKGK